MAESGELQCESCQYEHGAKSASKWCTDCKEGFCDTCCWSHKAANQSKNHHMKPAKDFLKPEKLNIILECPDHDKPFDFYCPTHDSVVCVVCVCLKHDGCKNLRALVQVAKGTKTSNFTALTDLEETTDSLLENIENGVRHLQQNERDLKEQEEVIKKSITTKRAEISEYLDRLEEEFLETLKLKSQKAVEEISSMTTRLETQRKSIMEIKDTTQNMKQCSSNLHVFVGIRSMLNTVGKERNGIKLLLRSIPQFSIAVKINPTIDIFEETFGSLAEIHITSKTAIVPYVERLLMQAQYPRPPEPMVHTLDSLQLKLKTNINMGEENSDVTSCLILPNKYIMIASYNKPYLTILKEDGSYDTDIHVPYNPHDVTKIDAQRVAVSYGSEKVISIVNPYNENITTTLKNISKNSILGITYNDGKLYVMVEDEGIKIIDLDGNVVNTIRIYKDAWNMRKFTTKKDKIYYSVYDGSVHCVDMDGIKLWTYQDDTLQNWSVSPAIAVDNYGITFAAGNKRNVLLAISQNGQQHKVLLTSTNGLECPDAVYYDKDSEQLLVCNRKNGQAAVYDVIY